MSRTDRMTSDLHKTGPVERHTEQAITALKKGAVLLKYGRRGKPKFCPFHLLNVSLDESVLIWFSGKEEKHLKLSHVSRIIFGQRTISVAPKRNTGHFILSTMIGHWAWYGFSSFISFGLSAVFRLVL